MQVKDKNIVVTGAGRGIGQALCRRFAQEGARSIVVADIRTKEARQTAEQVNGLAVPCDVSRETEVVRLVETAVDHFGPIDLFCSNAGISVPGGLDVSDQDWDRIIDINFKAHLYAARAVVPAMIERGEGHLLQTVSAAGLLTQIGSAPYSVTKHAALAFAEWLAINYGEQGLKVSCLCPQGVLTKLLLGETGDRETFLTPGAITVEQTADSVIDGLADERFLILPHPEVAEYVKRKAADRDRWIRGMRRLQARAMGS